MIEMCSRCAVGQFDLCISPVPVEGEEGVVVPCGWAFQQLDDDDATPKTSRERGLKSLEDMVDDPSAGRKRAAQLAPIMRGMRCEWSGLKFAGGGVIPILGCQETTLADVKTQELAREKGADDVGHRHHGPDKAVMNNAVGVNLHRVCSACHNRWHALNDKFYAKDRPPTAEPYLPLMPYYAHDPFTVYTGDEYKIAEAWWAKPVAERGPYPFVPEARRYAPLVRPTTDDVSSDLTEDPFK